MRPWVTRVLLPAVAVAGVLVLASPGVWADPTIPINQGHLLTTAIAYAHGCAGDQGGGPYADTDIWVFALPGNHAATGDLVSVTASFDSNADGSPDRTVTITAAAEPTSFSNGGPQTSRAWMRTAAGWRLTSASAVITGTAPTFDLTGTCPASIGGPVAQPAPVPAGTPGTGFAVAGFVVAGLALLGGATLLVLTRRRDGEVG